MPDVAEEPALIVTNTDLQLPNLETARAYLNQWPGSYQAVLDLPGIVGEVIDPSVLLGDEGFHSAFAFTLATDDGNGVDGLNLAGIFRGPTSTWFASVSLRTTTPRVLILEDSSSVAPYQDELRAIAGSGFISAYDSLVREALNAGTAYPRVLLPPVPMPGLNPAPAEREQ